jgi:hypothetical protein
LTYPASFRILPNFFRKPDYSAYAYYSDFADYNGASMRVADILGPF